jgi:hypothetical protein
MIDIPTIGDNFPPEATPFERWAELVDAANVWSRNVPKISNAEQAGRAQAFVTQLRDTTADVEAAWKKEREPHDLAIVALRAKYRAPLELLGIALDRMKLLAGDWLDREKARLAHEAAERKRLAAEAEAAALKARQEAARAGASVEAEAKARHAEEQAEAALALAAKPVERAQIKGEFSAKAMSLRSNWHAVIVNESAALKHYSRHPSVRAATVAAVQKEANKQAKAFKDPTRAPPGVEFRNDEKAV